MADSILLLSGGLDSLVLLARELSENRKPLCLTFAYGQRHETRETLAAQQIAGYYHVPHELVVLPSGLFGGSALTGGVALPVNLPPDDPEQSATVVPGRNLVLLSAACAVACRVEAKRVLFGANAGDNAIYSDCRWSFVRAVGSAMAEAYGVRLEVPFLGQTKGHVVHVGRMLGAPLELSWSCYMGGESPCNECGACKSRQMAGA